MGTRPVMFGLAAAAGLSAAGTADAQPAPPVVPGYTAPAANGFTPTRVQPAGGGVVPTTTVRPYQDWTPAPGGYNPPTAVQAGYTPPPTGGQASNRYPYQNDRPTPAGAGLGANPNGGTPAGTAARPRPGMAGGVQQAGGFDPGSIPPPNWDAPPATRPAFPPPAGLDPSTDTKFGPLPNVGSAPAGAVVPDLRAFNQNPGPAPTPPAPRPAPTQAVSLPPIVAAPIAVAPPANPTPAVPPATTTTTANFVPSTPVAPPAPAITTPTPRPR